MYMIYWMKKLNDFLTLNDREILEHAGTISAEIAKELAESEYEKFSIKQIHEDDDKEMRLLEEGFKKYNKKEKAGI